MIGVHQTSTAPAANAASAAWAQSSGFMSSTLASIRHIAAAGTGSGSTSVARTTLARSRSSASPAPQPIASARPVAAGPHAVTAWARIAAPVGVHSSRGRPPEAMTPPASRRISSAAGAGTGRTPWAQRSVPWPIATSVQVTARGASQASAAAVPTMSTIESIAPTSWNATSSTDVPCSRASARATRSNMSSARARVASSSGAATMRRRMSA